MHHNYPFPKVLFATNKHATITITTIVDKLVTKMWLTVKKQKDLKIKIFGEKPQ